MLAQRVTVLRDGRLRGSTPVDDVTDDELLAMIVGRQLDATFPPKPADDTFGDVVLEVDGLSGDGFSDVSFAGRRGEIIGVSGVVGNGQSDLLRALAGLSAVDGEVVVGGSRRSQRHLRKASGYMPADRHHDGLMMTLSVRENAALSGAGIDDRAGRFLSRSRELELVGRELTELDVRAPSMEAVGRRPLRRQPAEGRAGADAARPARDPAGRRAHPGRRRRRARRDLPHPARGGRRRHPGRRRLLRRQGARGPVRPGPRHVAGPRGGRPGRRRGHRGADDPRGRGVHAAQPADDRDATRRRSPRPAPVPRAATTRRWRSWPWSWSASGPTSTARTSATSRTSTSPRS